MAMPLPMSNGSSLSRMSWSGSVLDETHNERRYTDSDVSQALIYHAPAQKSNPVALSGHYSQSPIPAPPRQLSSPGTSSLGGTCMQPTWKGFIHTTRDGLIILEACLQGLLSHIPRRPHDRERHNIISSGNIFVYEENASGIRRWTDGITWSPSRIMGNFLVYRELLDGHPPGEKKRAAKKRKRGSEDLTSQQIPDANGTTEEDRQLIGSLSLESYNFKPGGLAKKTLSIDVRGIRHHIISYYRVEDVKHGYYHRPTEDDFLSKVEPRPELLDNPSFKSPVEDRDDKVNVLVSPQTQIQPSHHMQLVNAGVPVVVNVPQHPVHSHRRSLSRTLPPHSSPALGAYQTHSREHTGSPTASHISLGPMDPFDVGNMSQYHSNTPIPQNTRSRYPVMPQSSHGPDHKALPRSSPAVQQGEIRPVEKRMRHDILPSLETNRSSHTQQMMYFNNMPMATGVDLGISPVPSYSSVKYMDDIYHNSPHSNDFMNSPVYMLPQSQSYGG
jgi:hypothetical protein